MLIIIRTNPKEIIDKDSLELVRNSNISGNNNSKTGKRVKEITPNKRVNVYKFIFALLKEIVRKSERTKKKAAKEILVIYSLGIEILRFVKPRIIKEIPINKIIALDLSLSFNNNLFFWTSLRSIIYPPIVLPYLTLPFSSIFSR